MALPPRWVISWHPHLLPPPQPPPHQGRLMGSRGTFRAHVCGWSQCTGGGKTTAEPQGPATKQEKLRSLLASAQTMVLQPKTGLVNSALTEHLDRNEALAVKTSLALATVDVLGTHMRHLFPVIVYIAPIAPQWVQLHNECTPGIWLQWISGGDLVKRTSESHQGQVPAYPWFRWGQDQCQHRVTRELAQHMKDETQSTLRGEHRQTSNTQWLPSQWVCSSPTRSEAPQVRAELISDQGPLLHQSGSRPHHRQWQPQRKGEAALKIQAGSGQNSNNQPPLKGIRAQVSGPPHPPRSRHQSKRN